MSTSDIAALGTAYPVRPMVLHPRVVIGAGGGPDKTVLNSPRFLRPLGYDSICVYLRPPGDAEFAAIRERAKTWSAGLEEIDDQGIFDWKIYSKALEICRRHNVAIWHGHDYKTNLLGLLLARRWPMRLVSTVHGWVHQTRKMRLYYALDRWALKRYDHVVCVSEDLRQTCLDSGIAPLQCTLIENAIDTSEFQRRRTPQQAKQTLGLDTDVPLIGAVGRLSAEKGFDILIDACQRLLERGFRFRLAILGDGELREELQNKIDFLGRGDVMQLAGFQADMKTWYEAMDLFVLSSRREGLPNVVLEAMAMETPVVATAVAGVPHLLENNESGLIVPIEDCESLASAMAQVLDDPSLAGHLSQNARDVIESRYSFAVRMEKMASIYENLGVLPGIPDAGSSAITIGE